MHSFPDKVTLGVWPTPLQRLNRLSKELDVDIYIKRDDLSGLALGGNKTRKLEFILAEAQANNADVIVTAGAEQSNHCRQTAAAARLLGLDCVLVLGGSEPESLQGNLLLNDMLGVHLHWSGDRRKGEDIPEVVKELKRQGRNPYVVPYGGSNSLGTIGYVNAMYELSLQLNAMKDLRHFDQVVFASSSGATHAGIQLGNEILGLAEQIVGINIDKDEVGKGLSNHILKLVRESAQELGVNTSVATSDIILNNDYLGEGYARVGSQERHALFLMARLEAIFLDPVYSGRAFAGLLGMIERGQIGSSDKVLFWHTGGTPALFAFADQLGHIVDG